VADIYAAYELLQEEGAENVSFDLISGLPYQSLKQWQASLEEAIALKPQHLSVYDLIVEPKTVFARRYESETHPLPDGDTAAEFYRQAIAQLQAAGYHHYEISNHAQPGYTCQHNQTYWHNHPYYGFGMGATSYTQGQRLSRPRTRVDYVKWLECYLEANGHLDALPVSPNDLILETLMLRLRLAAGIPIPELEDNLSPQALENVKQAIAPYVNQGWVHWGPEAVRLSDPEGFLFSNSILSTLFNALDSEGN
jgi:oxygen-independent coproporphyrinogen-3 oxidase